MAGAIVVWTIWDIIIVGALGIGILFFVLGAISIFITDGINKLKGK